MVGGGSSSRFGSDKLMAPIAGEPLMAHTVRAVEPSVDRLILVCRHDQREELAALELGVELAEGGPSRTASEMSGLSLVDNSDGLVGIHDAARPLVQPELIERLFSEADRVGGAIPVLEPEGTLVDRASLEPAPNAFAAQTPQVFRAVELLAAYRLASEEGFEGHDTAEVVHRYSSLEIAAVPGDASNIKVTCPADLEVVERAIGSRT